MRGKERRREGEKEGRREGEKDRRREGEKEGEKEETGQSREGQFLEPLVMFFLFFLHETRNITHLGKTIGG